MAWWDSPRGAGFSSKAAAGDHDHLESNKKERSRETQLAILLLITQESVANLTALGLCSSSRVEDEAMIQLLGRVLHWNISWLDIIASRLDHRGLADLADVLERGRCGLLHFGLNFSGKRVFVNIINSFTLLLLLFFLTGWSTWTPGRRCCCEGQRRT